MIRLELYGCFLVVTATLASPAFAQKDACGLLTQQQVALIVAAPVTSAKLSNGVISQACAYLTAPSGGTGMGIIYDLNLQNTARRS